MKSTSGAMAMSGVSVARQCPMTEERACGSKRWFPKVAFVWWDPSVRLHPLARVCVLVDRIKRFEPSAGRKTP
jgi:hypothetical protein